MWFPQTSDGDYIFETDDKLIFTDGNYTKPKINSVIVFENLNADEIEFGKEMAYYAAQRGEDSQECYEAIRDVLGQEYVTRTNPYPDKAYQGSKNSQGKGNYSLEVDNGNEPKIKYSLSNHPEKALPIGSMKNGFQKELTSYEWVRYYDVVNGFDWDSEMCSKEFTFAVKLNGKTILSTYKRGKPQVYYITHNDTNFEEGVLYDRAEAERILRLIRQHEIQRNETSSDGFDSISEKTGSDVRKTIDDSQTSENGFRVYDGRKTILHSGTSENLKKSEDVKSIKYSLSAKDSDTVPDDDFGNDYSVILPKQEYAMVSKAIMAKNAGLKENHLKPVDYVYAANEFYVFKNHSLGNFSVFGKFEIETESKRIKEIKEVIDNGTYADGERFDRLLDDIVRGGKRSHRWNYGGIENRRATTGNVRVSGFQSSSNTIGHLTGISKNKEPRYALSTQDNDTEFWQEWLAKAKEYGVIPKGENPVRELDVPRKISKDSVVSRFARTMMEAGITPDENISDFEKAILNGEMTHEVITNKQAQNRARRQIEYLGFEEALQRWTVLSEAGKVGKNELALGMELYNQCITNKDVRNAMKIAAELASEATRAGQTLQACRMLKLMTPDGQLYYLEKSIQKMNDEFRDKIGEKYKDITLDEELMEEFLLEKDLEKRDGIYDKICQNIADQIPSTLLDKWNSWRYLAMLGNPRTHIRNIVGNAIFIPALRIKNYTGVVLERASKIKKEERTKSFRKSQEAVVFATKDFETMSKVLQGENAKYAVTSDIEGKRTIFKTRWLEKLRLKNFDFLEKEDMWFLKKHYVDSLARLITVRELDVNQLDSAKLDTIRAIAVKEAQRATYRDGNSLAEALNRIQKRAELSDNKVYRSTSVLIEGVMPYKKTPLNIAKQGVFYSPVGVLVGTYKTLKNLKNGNSYSATEIIDDFSKGLTGLGIMLLGMFLAKLGLLSGEADEVKKKREFDKMTGELSYALKIGKSSYTIDWMTPSCLPLFIGLELHELTKDEFEFADITAALSTLAEPLLELSVFSGVSRAIDSAKYSETNSVFAITSEMVNSYFLQALPTIGGQLSRIMDSGKREYYYTDKNSDIPRGLQNFIGQASSKIPFASYLFAPSVDEWGREEKYGNVFERIFENTASPGYYAEENYSYVDKELKELYERTGENSVFPTTQEKYYKEAGEQFYMDAELYSEVKKYRGRRSFELVQALIKSSKYHSMNDAEKVKAIKKCYETAGEETKERMFEKVKRNSKK